MPRLRKALKEQVMTETRQGLLAAAAVEFAREGYVGANVNRISQAAGFAKGTIYNYFKNKRDLLVAMVNSVGVQSVKNIMAVEPPDNPKEFLRAILNDRYQIAQAYGYHMAPMIAEMFVDADLREAIYQQIAIPIASYLEKYIQANIDSGRFRQTEPVIATRALVGMVFVNFALKFSKLDPRYENVTPDSLIEQLISIFLDGLLVDEQLDKNKRQLTIGD